MNSRKLLLLVIFSIFIIIVLYFQFSFSSYNIINTLPINVEAKFSQNQKREYYFQMTDSLKLSYHDEIKGRYYKNEKYKTKIYWNVPGILSVDSNYIVIHSDNSSMDDGIAYFLPFKYSNIDIYKSSNLQLIQSIRIDQYVNFAYFDKTIYLIFKDGKFGEINI